MSFEWELCVLLIVQALCSDWRGQVCASYHVLHVCCNFIGLLQ